VLSKPPEKSGPESDLSLTAQGFKVRADLYRIVRNPVRDSLKALLILFHENIR
jgi:hypothetical protein